MIKHDIMVMVTPHICYLYKDSEGGREKGVERTQGEREGDLQTLQYSS